MEENQNLDVSLCHKKYSKTCISPEPSPTPPPPISFLQDDQLVQAQRVAITVKDFNYYIGHAYVALGRLDVQLDRPAPRHLRLYAPRRTEMRRIFQQLRSMPPQPPSGYIIDIQREGEGGGAGAGAGSTGNTRAMISRGPAGLFGSLAGLAGADRNQTLSEALGRQSRSGGLEELVNRTTGPDFKATLAEVKKEQDERQRKEAEDAEKAAEAGESSEKSVEASSSTVPSDTSTSTKPAAENKVPKLETKEEEAMDTSEQPDQEKQVEKEKAMEHEAPMEQDKPVEPDKPASSETLGASVSAPGAGGSGGGTQGAAGGEGEKKESREKKEGGEGEGEEDSETPQYLARLLSELITGMVAPGMEGAPNDGT